MQIYNFTQNSSEFTSNAYLILGEKITLVDSGSMGNSVEILQQYTSTIDYLLLTHQHSDHIGSLDEIMDAFSPELYCYDDHPRMTSKLTNHQRLLIGDEWHETLHTPGHSEDHVVFLGPSTIFTGDIAVYNDSAFENGSFGRTDLPGGSRDNLISSLELILSLLSPTTNKMYSGHGNAFHGDVYTVIELALQRAKERKPKYGP